MIHVGKGSFRCGGRVIEKGGGGNRVWAGGSQKARWGVQV